jgi:C4-dicarboxylate transporter DctM subunit
MDLAANSIISASPNAVVMIIPVDLLLLGPGMILDAISISHLIMPILISVFAAFKIDPLVYEVVFISVLAIGQATPPVGANLFTAANLFKGELDSVAKQAVPFIIMESCCPHYSLACAMVSLPAFEGRPLHSLVGVDRYER